MRSQLVMVFLASLAQLPRDITLRLFHFASIRPLAINLLSSEHIPCSRVLLEYYLTSLLYSKLPLRTLMLLKGHMISEPASAGSI